MFETVYEYCWLTEPSPLVQLEPVSVHAYATLHAVGWAGRGRSGPPAECEAEGEAAAGECEAEGEAAAAECEAEGDAAAAECEAEGDAAAGEGDATAGVVDVQVAE